MTRSKQTKILAVLEDKSVCIGYNTCNDNTYIYMEEK